MRFIQDLAPETIQQLEQMYKHSASPRTRQRAQCLLLSYDGYSVPELAEIFRVHPVTIYNWFNAWEARQFEGLSDLPGRGNTPKIDAVHHEQIRAWARQFPRQLLKIQSLIHDQLDILVSTRTLSRLLNDLGITWRRVRRKVSGEPDPEEFAQKTKELDALEAQHQQGVIDLRYVDETGFCLYPYVPYAWQEKGETISLPSGRSPRLNTVGFFNVDNDFQAYTFECSIDSDIMIACIDEYCKQVTRPTVLVLDQASIHTSDAFTERLADWKAQRVEIFYLPTYSPHLNRIEMLWRFMKYWWLDFDAYTSWKNLVDYVEDILKNIGTKYKINFV
jgi:transposase